MFTLKFSFFSLQQNNVENSKTKIVFFFFFPKWVYILSFDLAICFSLICFASLTSVLMVDCSNGV